MRRAGEAIVWHTQWPPWMCPVHGHEPADESDELACPLGHAFPVVAGIPRFVTGRTYSDAFGVQWNRYRRTQLDSYTGTTISRDLARHALGEDLREGGSRAGTCSSAAAAPGGSGGAARARRARHLGRPQRGRRGEPRTSRPASVTGLRRRTSSACRSHRARSTSSSASASSSTRRVPSARSSGSTSTSDRVEPSSSTTSRTGFRGSPAWLRSFGSTYGGCPPAGPRHTERLVRALLPLHRRLPRLRPLLGRVTPVYSYYDVFPELPDSIQREWALLDTHDGLTDWHKHFRSCDDVLETLRRLGLEDAHCARGGNGIEARGRRPGGGAG